MSMRRGALRGLVRARRSAGVQLFALRTARVAACLHAEGEFQARLGRRCDDRVSIQQAQHPSSVLRDVRHPVLRARQGPGRRRDGRGQCAVSRRRRCGFAQGEEGRRAQFLRVCRMAGKWTRIEVGLVLQGGGALGAYEWGAIEALFARMDELEHKIPVTLKVVTGVSIGAINGACIVGAQGAGEAGRRTKGLKQLASLWNDLKLETPFRGRYEMPFGLPSVAPGRDMSLLGLPGFYAPRSDVWNAARWTSIYDTSPLKATLDDHVCFEAIDASRTRSEEHTSELQ